MQPNNDAGQNRAIICYLSTYAYICCVYTAYKKATIKIAAEYQSLAAVYDTVYRVLKLTYVTPHIHI